jgi:hypothetical protein
MGKRVGEERSYGVVVGTLGGKTGELDGGMGGSCAGCDRMGVGGEVNGVLGYFAKSVGS